MTPRYIVRRAKQLEENVNKNSYRLAAIFAASVLASVACGRPAAATPSGLGFYPSTDVYGPGIFHFDVDRYSINEFSGAGVADSYGLTYGIGDKAGIGGRNEIGIDYFSNSGVSFGKSLYFNGKTQLYDDPKSGVRAVAGLWLAGDTKNPAVSNTGYLLASKAFSFGRVHVGVAHAFSPGNIRSATGSGDATFLHLAYDRALTDKILVTADYYSGRSFISGTQPSVYYSLNDKAGVGLGYFFCNEPRGAGFNNDQLYLCFDYNFGGPKAAPPSEGAPGAPGT